MQSVAQDISTEGGTEGIGCLSFGGSGIRWAKDIAELGNGRITDELHTGGHIGRHEGGKVGVERLALVLLIQGGRVRLLGEFAHLQLANFETAGTDGVDDLAGMRVTVRFDQSESALGARLELLPGEDVGIVGELQLPGVDLDA